MVTNKSSAPPEIHPARLCGFPVHQPSLLLSCPLGKVRDMCSVDAAYIANSETLISTRVISVLNWHGILVSTMLLWL